MNTINLISRKNCSIDKMIKNNSSTTKKFGRPKHFLHKIRLKMFLRVSSPDKNFASPLNSKIKK